MATEKHTISPVNPGMGNIIFTTGGGIEMIKLSKGKFYYKGRVVKDVNKIYERFCEWMYMTEIEQKKLFNPPTP